MLGGGTFTAQNKVLPGAYINFVSAARAAATIGSRGVATMPLTLDWGKDGEVFKVTQEDFLKNSKKIFGYAYDEDAMKPLRDLFLNCQILFAYKLNKNGVKASNTFCTALYGGKRGNDLKTVISTNVDDSTKFDVYTYLGTSMVDLQTVASADKLIDNDYVTFKKDATLAATAGTNLAGGTNGEVTGDDHQAYLDKIESYSFNTMGVTVSDETTLALYVNFTKRMRDNVGAKFQLVVYNKFSDYEGVIGVMNKPMDSDDTAALVFWVTGAESACEINATLTNKEYDGEYEVNTDYNQAALEEAIKGGKFAFHKVGENVRVLEDINTLVTVTDEKGEDFKSNQTVRVLDQIANDIATLFNTKYLGAIQNDKDGRVALWSDVVQYYEQLQTMRAITEFSDKDVEVSQGETKKSVVVNSPVTVVNAMEQLYMTVVVQ